jgi:hypothetical protein
MKFKAWLIGMALCMTLLPLSAVYAASTEATVKASNKADFTDVVAAVQQEMKPGGRYEFVDDTERATINTKLGNMQSLFDKYPDVAQMNQDAKVQLFSDQETVNAILTHRDDRRMVCKSERPLGSLLPKRTCRTYGEIERNLQNSQQFMEQQARPGVTLGGH